MTSNYKRLMCKLQSYANAKGRSLSLQSAFALPTLVVTATILMIAGVSVAQTTVSVSTNLRAQNWQDVANEAANAGASYAYSCLKANGTAYWTSSLKPSTTCAGANNSGSAYISDQAAAGDNPHWRSSFTVDPPDSNHKALVTGKVELLDSSSTVTKTWTSTKTVIVNVKVTGSSGTATQVSAGEGYQSCAVSSGKEYCWGLTLMVN